MNTQILRLGLIMGLYSLLILFSPDKFNIGGILGMSIIMIIYGIFNKSSVKCDKGEESSD